MDADASRTTSPRDHRAHAFEGVAVHALPPLAAAAGGYLVHLLAQPALPAGARVLAWAGLAACAAATGVAIVVAARRDA